MKSKVPSMYKDPSPASYDIAQVQGYLRLLTNSFIQETLAKHLASIIMCALARTLSP